MKILEQDRHLIKTFYSGHEISSSRSPVTDGKVSRRKMLSMAGLFAFSLSPFALSPSHAVDPVASKLLDEDGYQVWLRYGKISDSKVLSKYRSATANIFVDGTSPTDEVAGKELERGLSGLLGQSVLYGTFAFLRLLQTHSDIDSLAIADRPKNAQRILAHGDNLDGSIERGYAGRSLWHWDELPGRVDSRLFDYARLIASIGLNGVVLNKVDADPAILDSVNLPKIAALAAAFRPYGMKVYVCANFGAPKVLGGLNTADPLDSHVCAWWREKADEIYKLIADFGGFVVKANSEGLPGPQDCGRTHADSANMLGAALAPHGGIVMWRAFVYTVENQDVDRVERSYLEFKPLDGQFAPNVLILAKNGPLDFQPREPFHPLFGATPRTRLVGELEVSQEYLGQSTHLVYLGTMWEEFLRSNTYSNGANSTVADIIESWPVTDVGGGGMSATANTGSDRNWCGHHFAQANWFVYGRLFWNPKFTAAEIALDWIKMTWTSEPAAVAVMHQIMMQSREAYVSYTMPLGLHHLVGGDHYAPMPQGEGDPRGIFHHAALEGIGYDRTRETGSDAVDQYHEPLNEQFNNVHTCPEKLLLWFHHVSWDYRMKSGRTLWDELCYKYDDGAKQAVQMENAWLALAPFVDGQRHREVAAKLRQQAIDAKNWSNLCLNYFQKYSHRPRAQVSRCDRLAPVELALPFVFSLLRELRS